MNMKRTLITSSWILLLASGALRGSSIGPPDRYGSFAETTFAGTLVDYHEQNGFGSSASGGAQASVTGSPFMVVTSSSGAAPKDYSYQAQAIAYYAYRLEGPGTAPVSMRVLYSLSASSGDLASGSATFQFGDQGVSIVCNGSPGTNCPNGHSGSFQGSFNFFAIPGTISSVVHMAVGAASYSTPDGRSGGTASAFVDPLIEVDPSFPNANLYTVTLSDGVANGIPSSSSTTPEPAPIALLGVGLGALALLQNRRLRKTASGSRGKAASNPTNNAL